MVVSNTTRTDEIAMYAAYAVFHPRENNLFTFNKHLGNFATREEASQRIDLHQKELTERGGRDQISDYVIPKASVRFLDYNNYYGMYAALATINFQLEDHEVLDPPTHFCIYRIEKITAQNVLHTDEGNKALALFLAPPANQRQTPQ